ncbi:MAG: cyclic nucleotide-binding domain-containing protein [Anaerolineales bacterium]|nr:cyclic nucleotide-binding domain-containing protein [Anaerolineales bacterium]
MAVMNDPSQILEVLQLQHFFMELDEQEFAEVAARFQVLDVPAEAYVSHEGEEGYHFFIILEGSARVVKYTPKGERNWGVLKKGSYFGEEALLFKKPRPASVITLEPSRLLRMGRDDFYQLLDQYPQMRRNLAVTAESRYLAHKEAYPWLAEDELIYLIKRKHEFHLFRSLALPVLLGLASIPVMVFGLAADGGAANLFWMLLGGLGELVAVAWGAWNWVDWGNDRYIVTDQRVVWLERVAGLYSSRREAPLTNILAVNVVSSQLGRILNYGNIEVRTYTGSILMRNAAQPHLFASFVKCNQASSERRSKEVDARLREIALRKRLGLPLDAALTQQVAELAPPAPSKPYEERPMSLRESLDTFFKVRYEKDGVITYRKHWLLLLRKTFLPTLGFLGLLALTAFLVWQGFARDGTGLASLLTWFFLLGVTYVAVLLWWGYHYWDWRNDIYRLTPDQIHDIERKPLGKEDKKTANLDAILSIEHTRDGILELLLNFGDVTVNIGQTKFIFHGVFNPDQVHQDVADYIEARNRKKRLLEAARERERMVDWLTSYHQQAEYLDDSGNEFEEGDLPG